MIGGELFRGSEGYGGEVGHTTLYSDGEVCGCGRKGCWETYVSPPAILRRVRQELANFPHSAILKLVQGDSEKITMETIIDAAHQEDPLALNVFHEVGMHMAVGISNLVNLLNPELVVLGGVLCDTSPWLIPVIKESLQKNILIPLRKSIRIEASVQGLNACTLGAVALVLDDIVQQPLYPR